MHSVIKVVLPKSGIASNIPTSIRDGLIGRGEVGVSSLFHYQGIFCTAMVVEQVNMKTPTGIFLLIFIEDLVQDAGLYGSILNMSFNGISRYIQSHFLICHT